MPSYGELIDLLSEAEHDDDVPKALCHKFSQEHPDVPIGRPGRFYETVKRIAAPTRPSLRGEVKLYGSPLSSYRKRKWTPRIRTLDKF